MMKKISKRSINSKAKKADVYAIPRLITKQDWKTLRHILTTFPKEVIDFMKKTESGSIGTSAPETMMHLCCRYHPPLDVIHAIYDCHPEAILKADEMGRFPIHTACRCGASLYVVCFLIEYSSEAIMTAQDRRGKTPLHLCSQHYLQLYDPLLGGAGNISGYDAILEVVKRLCAKAPDVINMEDDEEQTALEIAIEVGAPLKVVKKLQKLSEKDWKARRGLQHSHDDMRQHFYSQMDNKRKILEQDQMDQELALAFSGKVDMSSKDEEKGDSGAFGTGRTPLLSMRRNQPTSARAHAA